MSDEREGMSGADWARRIVVLACVVIITYVVVVMWVLPNFWPEM